MGENIVQEFDVLACVERFLLPSAANSVHVPKAVKDSVPAVEAWLETLDVKLLPRKRLELTCIQVCLADHLKTMQTMYRDPDDDQQVCMDMRLTMGAGVKLTTKALQDKLMEGQSRIVALSRMCYGHNSLEMIRARNDLAATFAQQGLWTQAKEIIDESHSLLLALIESPAKRSEYFALLKSAKESALIVLTVFRLLRSHMTANGGQVTRDFVRDLVAELAKLPSTASSSTLGNIAASGKSHLSDTTKLVASIHAFLVAQPKTPSWGSVIDYLRRDCMIMRQLMSSVEDALLPQQRAAFLLAFQQCDQLQKGVANSHHLSQVLPQIPSSARVITGTGVIKFLQQIKTEVSLQIDLQLEEVVDIAKPPPAGSLFNPHYNNPNIRQVVYELPVSLEEVLSYVIMEQDVDPVMLEMAHLLTLQGIVQVFTGKLSEAEHAMREALRYFEQQGLEMEIVTCELYNTIAQMMIVKFRQLENKRKVQIKKAATAWLLTEQGRKELREQMRVIRAHYMNKNMLVISAAESELRAKNHLIKQKMKEIKKFASMGQSDDGIIAAKMVEAAFRYVIRSYEILETVHGPNHAAVATACLAVASVANLGEKFADAREWLSRALRSMAKLSPVPVRSIAYAQVQLAEILASQKHIDEAITVLSRAVVFYVNQSTERLHYLAASKSDEVGSVYRSKPFPKGLQPYEDIEQALTLGNRLVGLQEIRGNVWPAAEQTEQLADLAELAYGWDYIEVGELRKQVGKRYFAIQDFGRAAANFKRCLETMECVYEKGDPHCLEANKLLQTAMDRRASMFDQGEATGKKLLEIGDTGSSPPRGNNNANSNTSSPIKGGKTSGSSPLSAKLKAAWALPTDALIQQNINLEAYEAVLEGEIALQQGPVVGHGEDHEIIAKFHAEMGIAGGPAQINDGEDPYPLPDNVGNTQPQEPLLSHKRLQRQPNRMEVSSGNNSSGNGATSTFQFDDDLDLF